jgi:hypothetical protein
MMRHQRVTKFEEALSSYHQALAISPDDSGVHNIIGARAWAGLPPVDDVKA